MKNYSQKLTTCAIFSAIICIVTTFVAIPAPSIGNINLGDVFILCSAWLLGPYGAIASGIGACLADLLSGFAIYAPATLVIKFTMAMLAHYIYSTLSNRFKFSSLSLLISAICAEAVMIIGYFLYEWLIYGLSLASSSIAFNSIQGTACTTIGIITGRLLFANRKIRMFFKKFKSL